MDQGAGPVTLGIEIGVTKMIQTHEAAVHGLEISVEGVDLAPVALRFARATWGEPVALAVYREDPDVVGEKVEEGVGDLRSQSEQVAFIARLHHFGRDTLTTAQAYRGKSSFDAMILCLSTFPVSRWRTVDTGSDGCASIPGLRTG